MATEELRRRLFQYSKDILKTEDFHDELAPAIMGYTDLLSEYLVIDNECGLDRY